MSMLHPLSPTSVARLALALVLAAGLAPAAAAATLPLTGAVRTEGGGPAPDGKYVLITSIYTAVDAAKPVWDEVQKSVQISGGLFVLILGADKPIPEGLLASNQPLWLGVQVGAEPELPRIEIGSVPRAVYAKVAGSAAFAYAASDAPGGLATGVKCTGCLTGDLIAPGTIQALHVAFAYAGSDQKNGAASEAKHAVAADGAKFAEKAALAEELDCKGCVTTQHLSAATMATFLATTGGTITGKVTLEKGLDLKGSMVEGAVLTSPSLAALDLSKSPCTAKEVGQISANGDATSLYFCTGSGWKKVKLCTGTCLVPAQVACGKSVTDECGDPGQCAGKGTLCSADAACKADKCIAVVGTQTNPALRCKDILALEPTSQDGLYWIDPNGGGVADAFQVWCRMGGDYPGAALTIKRPGSVAGQENMSGDLNLPCTPSTLGYCKLSDDRINALRQTSGDTDPFIVLSYKNAGNTPFCRSFGANTCKWISNAAAAPGCNNAVARNSGQYCSRSQTTDSYRGLDGHTCGNLSYPGVTSPSNPFVIFEHAGGAHYCGGWDTTWDHVELLVQ